MVSFTTPIQLSKFFRILICKKSIQHNLIFQGCEVHYTVCPTLYRTRHFFNNSNTNEDNATKFEQKYVRCVRNEEECVCRAPNCRDTEQHCNILICGKIIKEMPGSVASGTHCI